MDKVACSKDMEEYMKKLKEDCKEISALCSKIKKRGVDVCEDVEVVLASTLAERVVGLIAVISPQLNTPEIPKRITELEKKYGVLDWRVAMKIGLEVAQENFCKFKDRREAIETGIRLGFAYLTLGVVSAPIEGFIGLELVKRNDGKGEYFRLTYGGPIRGAGGTMAAVSVLIADYIRKQMGYSEYDPTTKEIKRAYAELEDYHNFVTNLQYFPSEEEIDFLASKIPVQIIGDPSEKREISNFNLKNIPRIKTDRISNGFCLMFSAALPLKAPKLLAKIEKWGKEFSLDHWLFLRDFIEIQKKAKARGEKKEEFKITPDYTYISDIVAGRPVLSYPLRTGGFRLRYGRSRASGYSAQSIHPATMHVLDNYIASATHIKTERPSKGAALTVCDSIEGPIVRLRDGSVIRLETEAEAKKHKKEIEKILYLGDLLISYGDFFDRAHPLVPAGYCEEWWVQEFEKNVITLLGNLDYEKLTDLTNINQQRLKSLFTQYMKDKPTLSEAWSISLSTNTPLHPKHTLFWSKITRGDFYYLLKGLKDAKMTEDKIVADYNQDMKNTLEILGIPHKVVNKEYVVFEGDEAELISLMILTNLDEFLEKISKYEGDILELLNTTLKVKQRDKAGIFIGARMGRPEKAKMRKMVGSPHVLFPVGDEGGRMRSFQSVIEKGYVIADFPVNYCNSCKKTTPLFLCEDCDRKTERRKWCKSCGVVKDCPHNPSLYRNEKVNIKETFLKSLKNLGYDIYPDMVKGVRGTSNKEHIPEHISKGILRAKHNLAVNKDGTIRFDASEVPLTYFKPKEIRCSIEKLKELGYKKDIYGKELEDENQLLELKPQDVILPSCPDSPDERADDVLFRTAQFIDEMLVRLYKEKPFYNIKTKEELIGHYVVGLAPHTSAGTLGRIIGFSKTQGFFAHPLFHAAMRRDCDGDEASFMLLLDVFLNFSKHYLPDTRGSKMDAPLVLSYNIDPYGVDEMIYNIDVVFKYPLEFYEAALEYKKPWGVEIEQVKERIGKEEQFENYKFTHDTEDINEGVLCSAYKTLPTMEEKLAGQMRLALKIRAVDAKDVARLIIEKHFLRDLKGNLRKFSQQQYRCVNCNEKFRRPPLTHNCTKCGGRIIFTVSEGSVLKYLKFCIDMAEKYHVSDYLKQNLALVKMRIESIFGREEETQAGLNKWVSVSQNT